ncbi:SpoIIE family protein phosphatase [Streptomyces sp. ISL-98]|nr:SpoIIE family protein phosphatase [Streptomyces sp. ISL-98]
MCAKAADCRRLRWRATRHTETLPDGRVLLAVGDIAGHGVESATRMVALRNALHGLAFTGRTAEHLRAGELGGQADRLPATVTGDTDDGTSLVVVRVC